MHPLPFGTIADPQFMTGQVLLIPPDVRRKHMALSIKSGMILPSDILRRLGSYSRKNKLYFALRELGRVVRTMFLLRYISEAELRQVIQTATNKSERFNEFVQWISFGGDDVIAENIRDEQRKFIKYNHLVANILAFHNLVSMTKAIDQLKAQGQEISNEVLAAMSPYQTSHINRFGQYQLQSRRVPEPLPLVRKPARVETAVVSPGLAAGGGSLHLGLSEDFARIVLRGEASDVLFSRQLNPAAIVGVVAVSGNFPF